MNGRAPARLQPRRAEAILSNNIFLLAAQLSRAKSLFVYFRTMDEIFIFYNYKIFLDAVSSFRFWHYCEPLGCTRLADWHGAEAAGELSSDSLGVVATKLLASTAYPL